MAQNLYRNALVLLFVLTLANLAASFSALMAIRTLRTDYQRLELSMRFSCTSGAPCDAPPRR